MTTKAESDKADKEEVRTAGSGNVRSDATRLDISPVVVKGGEWNVGTTIAVITAVLGIGGTIIAGSNRFDRVEQNSARTNERLATVENRTEKVPILETKIDVVGRDVLELKGDIKEQGRDMKELLKRK